MLQSLRIDTAHLLGLSDGGIVGYRLAASCLIQVEKLITVGAAWRVDDIETIREPLSDLTPDSFRAELPQAYADYRRLNPDIDFAVLTEATKGMWFDDTPTGYPGERVRQIRCPTLLIRGDEDDLFSRASVAELADRIANATLFTIPSTQHIAFEDQLELFRMVLEQFLNA